MEKQIAHTLNFFIIQLNSPPQIFRMKRFLIKIAIYLSFFLLTSCYIYYNSKHNLIWDKPAIQFVRDFNQSDLIIKSEIAEDRRTVYQLVKRNQNKHFNYLIIGSSRVMQIGKFTGFKNALNLGVSAANLYDIQAIYALIQHYNIHCDTLIVDINPWTVCPSIEKRYEQFNTFKNIQTAIFDISHFNFTFDEFKESIIPQKKPYFKADSLSILNPNNFIRFTDGSIKQKTLGPNMKAGRVDFFCRDFYLLKQFQKINLLQLDEFIKLVKKASKNQKVIVFMSPFHPKLFEINKHDIRVRNLSLLNHLIQQNIPKSIDIIGDFNPVKLKLNDSNFVDGFHINERTVSQLLHKQ